MLANISRPNTAPGSVAAARTPVYLFNWVRDAALVMSEVFEMFKKPSVKGEPGRFKKILLDYVSFNRFLQSQKPEGGLGEPKFHLDGSIFSERWGRPQNDGPALRALTLTKFAEQLVENGEADFVRSQLFDTEWHSTTAVIKKDLEELNRIWIEGPNEGGHVKFREIELDSWDAWEETRGYHFYTRTMQMAALHAGARLAWKMSHDAVRRNDTDAANSYKNAASSYQKTADHIEKVLNDPSRGHWDAKRGYLVENKRSNEGLEYNHNGLESLSVMATLHGYGVEGVWKPSHKYILATAQATIDMFRENYAFNANMGKAVAIGRYKEDQYYGGNPWVLATYTFGQFYYRVAQDFKVSGKIVIHPESLHFFKKLLQGYPEETSIETGHIFYQGDPVFKKVLDTLFEVGDQFLGIPKDVAGKHAEHTEQMDRHDGSKKGVDYLAWNYREFAWALRARDDAMNADRALRMRETRGIRGTTRRAQ
jgi:glucoamylase